MTTRLLNSGRNSGWRCDSAAGRWMATQPGMRARQRHYVPLWEREKLAKTGCSVGYRATCGTLAVPSGPGYLAQLAPCPACHAALQASEE